MRMLSTATSDSLPAGVDERGHFGGVAKERPDFALRTFHGVMLQRPGEREQEEQDDALIPLIHRRAAGRDGEHEEMNVQTALAKPLPSSWAANQLPAR